MTKKPKPAVVLEPRVTAYAVSALPEGHRDTHLFTVRVESRGSEQWAVCWIGSCLSRTKKWVYEPLPSSRTGAWKRRHRFTLEEALALAKKMAAGLVVNGTHVSEVLEVKGS